MAVINMQSMRYLNLLDKVARVKTTTCFTYNNTIFFAVHDGDVSKAIGLGAINIRKIQESLGKKVKIIREQNGIENVQRFVEDIIAPVRFKSMEIKDNCAIITAGNMQSKASLIGRNRRRFDELRKILHETFNLDLKIV